MGLSLGAIGLGGLGRIELDCYATMDDVDVVAGADVSPDARDAFEATYDAPAYADHEVMLANHDLDAVSISTPHALHAEQTLACFDAGADVFVEKPLATTISDAVAVVEAAREQGRMLQVGYQRHFDPLYRELRSVVQSGRIGAVHAATASLGQDWIDIQRGTWRTDPDLAGGGQLADSGSHLLDALCWTLDAEPRSVAAVLDDRGEAVDVNSALAVTLDSSSDADDGGVITASVGVVGDGTNSDPDESLVYWGTDGHVRVDGERLVVVEDDVRSEISVTDERDFETLTRRKLADFVAAVREGTEPAVPGAFGLQVTALTSAALRAAETGRTVDVQDRVAAARETLAPGPVGESELGAD